MTDGLGRARPVRRRAAEPGSIPSRFAGTMPGSIAPAARSVVAVCAPVPAAVNPERSSKRLFMS
ncbi:hypothetical protein [Salana multivorans]